LAKTITLLAVLLILQIGLCFGGTPQMSRWIDARHPPDPGEELGGSWFGLMLLQAGFCVVTIIGLAILALAQVITSNERGKKQEGETND
jgi:hypothetical protein